MTKIILASQSKTRKIIMDSLGIEYSIIPAHIDEKAIRDKNLKLRAQKIAQAKARHVASQNKGIIIASDTFCVCQGTVLEKPQDEQEAKKMLRLQSDNNCILYTGFCYIDNVNHFEVCKTAVTRYLLRKLSEAEINNFVKNNPVTLWSAAFSANYVYQSTFVEKINGSYSGMVYGLPMEFVIPCLSRSHALKF
jgi:septum formation protein